MNAKISQRIQQLAPSATLAVSEKARAMKEQGINVVSFGAGEPDFATPAHVTDAAIAALKIGDTKYPNPVAGINPLRDSVCKYLKQYSDVEYKREQVCVSVGAKDSLHLAFMSLLDPGDEVIIPAPYWVSYPDQVALAGGKPVFVDGKPENDLKITADQLASAITHRTRALVMNSPSNPTGAVYSRVELERLADVIRGKEIVVVSDEIYHRLYFGAEPAASFAALPGMFDQTLTVNGFSKTYAMTGWRLGYAAGPQWLISAMGKLQGQTTSGPTSFVQSAAVRALLDGQDDVETMRQTYLRRGQKMHAALNALPGVSCMKPHGAFYCFPDVAGAFARLGVSNADEFTTLVLEKAHVAVVSGTAFGGPRHVRMSYATSDALIDEGLARLAILLG
ncbi:MAG: pyridoxal phosphate-dependent aminotransferase [Phycisphaerae bacterium]